MKKKLWAVLVALVALTVFATSAFAAVRWRNVASIYPGISAGDNSYTCEISCLSGTTKIDCVHQRKYELRKAVVFYFENT